MPAQKWIVEPTNLLQRKPLPPDKNDDFSTFNQVNLVTIMRQLSQISLISNKLFEELLDDCAKLAKRTVKLNEKIKRLDDLVAKWPNAKKVKIPVSSIEKCRAIEKHFAIEQVIDRKLFTNNSRPICIAQRLEFIGRLDQEEKNRPVITPLYPPEPLYTGLPIKLIKKRKLNLLDIETQQPNNVFKLPRDDIVRRAQQPLCKSMVQLHSRPIDEELYNLTAACDTFGPLDHLMISSDHPLQKIKEKLDLQKQRLQNEKRTNLRTSRSTSVIHQKSITNNSTNRLQANHLESNHYCCTNISTGLSEMTNRTNFNATNTSIPSQLANSTILRQCSSCSNNTLTCTCSSSAEPIYMLPTMREQTEALSLEYPSNVVAINTDHVQFYRMSSFRKSLIHSDFCIKRKKVRLNKENSKLKRRNTICESSCHQRNCNLVHCSKRQCASSTTKHCEANELQGESEKHTERRRSTGSINLIDSCCQTDLTLDINLTIQSKSTNRLTDSSSTNRRSTNRKSSIANQVQAEIHSSYRTQKQEPMYEKINKKLNEADERSSSGNWSAASSTCASNSTKSPTQQDDDELENEVKRTSYSACSLAHQQQTTSRSDLCKNNSEINVINSDGLQFRKVNQEQQSRAQYANRDSESWLQFFESCNESTDTITNETDINREANELANRTTLKKTRSNSKFKPNRLNKRTNDLDSISPKHREEHEDELLSIHSEDTDGYYTSMHTDSGLFKERAQPPMNSTFISRDDDEKALESSSQVEHQTKSFMDTPKKMKQAPSPPVRSCSVMSNSSTLNNLELTGTKNQLINYDAQDNQDNSSVCSDATLSGHTNTSSQQVVSSSTNDSNVPPKCSTNESIKVDQNNQPNFSHYQPPSITSPSPANTWCSSMNSDIDLVKLRHKTTIDATAYPSMVAYPDSELSSISSFGNLAFASSGNHRCTVISKSKSASDNQQSINKYTNQYSNTGSYVTNNGHSSKRDSSSSLDSKLSKRSLSTIGSYASLTRLKELLKPLRNTLLGSKSSEKKAKKDLLSKKKASKDDCLADETKCNRRKGFFTRFGSINRGKIVKSNHLTQLQNAERENEEEPENEMIKLRNTINKWRIEPLSHEIQQANKVLNKTKEQSSIKQFSEEDENEYYAKLSEQSGNILRNSVDYSLNNDLKRYSIASNHSQTSGLTNGVCNSYLCKKQLQQATDSTEVQSDRNSLKSGPENRRSADNATFTKLFPISRYTSKVQPEEHQFIVPAIPTPTYCENVTNARFSYASDTGSNSLGLSNNSVLYASIPSRPRTLNLSASYNQPSATAIYGQQTMLSNSYNCPFANSSMNGSYYNSPQLNGHIYNGQSLNSSTSSSFYSSANNPPASHQILASMQQQPNRIPIANNTNLLNTTHVNHLSPQPVYHQSIIQPIHQTMNHQQISSPSSHQSTSSYNYLSSTSSSLVNTPSSLSSNSPFHQAATSQQINQPLNQSLNQQVNQQIIKHATNQFRNLPALTATNTAIVSPFCKQTATIKSTDSLKKSEEKLNMKSVNEKRSADDSVLSRTNNQIVFRDSMRLTRQQREQTLARLQHRSSWTPSSSMISSPSESLGSSSNSSTDQSTPCNDINKLINELSNFDSQPSSDQSQEIDSEKKSSGRSDPIYGVSIARTRFSFPSSVHKSDEDAIKGDFNVLKQSKSTNINDFKKLLSSKASGQLNGATKSASEQLKVTRKPLSALSELESVADKLNENTSTNFLTQSGQQTSDYYYGKETYDNVTDEECENQASRLDYKANNSSIISLVNQQHQLANGLNSTLRTRVINGRVYKTPYRLEAMHYPPINEEDNVEDGEFIVTNNQQNTSTWV